jgi:exonuclease SbcC
VKILSIRGENLASLHGPFAIDFEEEPLGRAGLFAITGPTGAGKSTLLDAICLALYGTTPRLRSIGGRGHAVGGGAAEERLTSNDPASLLRKGTAAGCAEVVFVGRDGARYRARWSVRRARDRVEGRLQAPQVELWGEETGEAIGRTRTEVHQEIEARVGLSYEQFCRSVLLAQGEFSRFLLANEKERAELLERVTGTEIYRHISVAAHERLREAREAVAGVEAELRGVRILTEEERAALEADRDRLAVELERVRGALLQAQRAEAWYETLGGLRAEAAQATADLERVRLAWEEGAGLRKRLAAVELVQPLRQLIEGVLQASHAEATAEAQLAAATEAEKTAAGQGEEAKAAMEEAAAKHRKAAERLEAAAPSIARARSLDQALETARRDAQRTSAAAREARERVAKQREASRVLREAIAAQEQTLQEAEAWLEGNERLQPLAAQWERWQALLLRVVKLRRGKGAAEAQAAALAGQALQLRERLLAAEGQVEGAKEKLAAAEARAAELRDRAAKSPRLELRERREALDRFERQVRELEQLASNASRARQEAARSRGRAATAATAIQKAQQRQAEGEGKRALLVEQLEGAEAARRKAHEALGHSEQRALLREGEACPLCGSCAHPWAEKNVAIATRLQEREAQVDALRRQLLVAEKERADAEAQAAAAEQAQIEAEREAAEWDQALASSEASWQRLRPALDRRLSEVRGQLVATGDEGAAGATIPDRAAEEDAGERLQGLLRSAAGAQRRSREKEEAADRLEQEVGEARRQVEELRRSKEQLEGAVRALEKELAGLSTEEKEQRLRAETAREEERASFAQVAPLLEGLGDDSEAFGGDPEASLEALDAAVQGWRRKDEGRREAKERLAVLQPRLDAAATLLEEQQGLAEAAARQAKEAAEALEELTTQRSELLGGETADAFEARLRADVRQAAVGLEAAREALGLAAEAGARATALRESCEGALSMAKASHLQAREARDRALAEAEVDLEEAQARLAHPQEELARWRRELLELDKAQETAKALWEVREGALRAHEEGSRPALDEAAARAAQQELLAPCAQAEEAFHDARNALRGDDEARLQSASILPRLEAKQKEAQKWAALHELIGSASGDKFQLFAQSMTLEVLLAHANVHLEELAPRYRLERVPGEDLQLQVVDRDMGDEIRAANSLSGGETFLVSLALALGLSGLSANTRVESLFVDEGFGSLDPQTLDVALASLDALQASGRKVGVISHVEGMAERIGVQIQVQPQGSGRSSVQVVRA